MSINSDLKFSFKPSITRDFLCLDEQAYEKKRRKENYTYKFNPYATIKKIAPSQMFHFQPNEFEKRNGHDTFEESCYRTLYTFTRPEALDRLKAAIAQSDFQLDFFEKHKQTLLIINDANTPFNGLPTEVRKLIMNGFLRVTK